MSLLLAPTKPPVIEDLMTANNTQLSVGMQMQSYCNTVLSQPNVSFKGFDTLAKFETEVNAGIATAKAHANHYLNDIQPQIISNITNMSNYFDVHQAVATSLPPGATKQEWLNALAAVKETADGYQDDAKAVVVLLQGLNTDLTGDVASFSSTVTNLNAAVDGDNGVLAGIDKQVSDIDGKVAGAITGIVLSGLAVVGGSIMILVGALAEIATAGLSTALMIGGAAVIVAGVGGAVGSGLALAGLLDAKADLISKKAHLQAEVKLAQGMRSGFKALGNQALTAVDAASDMRNAWSFLSEDLGTLSSNLNKGIISTDIMRQIWLTTANSAIVRVQGDIGIIKQQMTGVTKEQAPQGVIISEFVKDTAQKLDAAA
ncbi:HBL/NHE enterotoxin family protein [Aestuariimicrobium sp. Y1814]|uniref:HBL/NHE enterotoxin family protein n=1 Tax=Aestuariimicrobium sp. Y1814 TaxID=3418742 RepID=UPI003DA706C2